MAALGRVQHRQSTLHDNGVTLRAEYNTAVQVHPCMYPLEHCTTISSPPFILASALPNRHHSPNGCSRAFLQTIASILDDLHEDHLEEVSDWHGLLVSSNGRDCPGIDVLYAVQIHLEVCKELDFRVLSGRVRPLPCLFAKRRKDLSRPEERTSAPSCSDSSSPLHSVQTRGCCQSHTFTSNQIRGTR